MAEESSSVTPPTAFILYSWDGDDHKRWTKEFAARLRSNGINTTLDQWHAVPGDQLPHFMEEAISSNSYVLIVCTPNYKAKSNNRAGGVGYEGDIMTGEIYTRHNPRKFIPVLRHGDQATAMPIWLRGKYYIDLRGDPYLEANYSDLLTTLHNCREQAPPVNLDQHRNQKPPEFEIQKASPLKITFDKKRHIEWEKENKAYFYARIEIENMTDFSVENVSVRITDLEPLENKRKLRQKCANFIGRNLLVTGTGNVPYEPPDREVDLHPGGKATFDVVIVAKRISEREHDLRIADYIKRNPPISQPLAIWTAAPSCIPAGKYRIKITTQGKNSPPVSKIFKFWGTENRAMLEPED